MKRIISISIPIIVSILLLSVGYADRWWRELQSTTVTKTAIYIPDEFSADVGFARDMSVHHAQAVLMATLLYDRTEDENLRFLAYDMLTTQQAQIGMMRGWLDLWEYSPNSSEQPMAWMEMSMNDGMMPGMATSEQLNQLENLSGREAEILFMELMIPHHESGVIMANAASEQAETKALKTLAWKMAQGQKNEIEYMQSWLDTNTP